MSRRKMKPTRSAKVIAFKASPEADHDIVTWWESLPEGARSEALRSIIRAYLSSAGKATSSQISQTGKDRIDLASTAQIADDTAWIRATLMDLPDYLARLVEQAVVARPTNGLRTDNPIVEEPDQNRMEDEAVQRRRDKMKRSQW